MAITYVTGDATRPKGGAGNDIKVIAHICNDVGAWGAGFVVALSRRWMLPEISYRQRFDPRNEPPKLGEVLWVGIPRAYTVGEGRIVVANMIAQHGVGWTRGHPPIRYDALASCLSEVAERTALKAKASKVAAAVHMPRIGTGLAGGQWYRIESIIERTLGKAGLPVIVYDLPGKGPKNADS